MVNRINEYKKVVYAYYMDYIKYIQGNSNFELVFDGYIFGHYVMVNELKKNRKIAVIGTFSDFGALNTFLKIDYLPWYQSTLNA